MNDAMKSDLFVLVLLVVLVSGALVLDGSSPTANVISSADVKALSAQVQSQASVADSVAQNVKRIQSEQERRLIADMVKRELEPVIDQGLDQRMTQAQTSMLTTLRAEYRTYFDQALAAHARATPAQQASQIRGVLDCQVVNAGAAQKTGDQLCADLSKVCVTSFTKSYNSEYRQANCVGDIVSSSIDTALTSCASQMLITGNQCIDRGEVGGRRLVMRYLNQDSAVCCRVL